MVWYSPKTHVPAFWGAKMLAITKDGEVKIFTTDRRGDVFFYASDGGEEYSAEEVILFTPINLPMMPIDND